MSSSVQMPAWFDQRYFDGEAIRYDAGHLATLEAESRQVLRRVAEQRPDLLAEAVLFQREYENGLSLALGAASPAGREQDIVVIPIDRDPVWMVASGVHHAHCEWYEALNAFYECMDERLVILSLHDGSGGLIMSMFFPAADIAKLHSRRYLAQRFERSSLIPRLSRETERVCIRSFTGRLNADVQPR